MIQTLAKYFRVNSRVSQEPDLAGAEGSGLYRSVRTQDS
jgi:hypothetical protein